MNKHTKLFDYLRKVYINRRRTSPNSHTFNQMQDILDRINEVSQLVYEYETLKKMTLAQRIWTVIRMK